VSRTHVERVVLESGRATGVIAVRHGLRRFLPADLVVLAAGGLGTPLILERSGLECRQRLFADPVLCLAALRPGSDQQREMPMPFAVQRDGYILSPYFDLLSFLFNRRWRAPASDLFSLMIKLADSPQGGISGRGLDKSLTARDQSRLHEAVGLATEILRRFGIPPSEIFLGTVNAGHPGGMMPLSEREAASLHPEGLPENLYLADVTLLPDSLGNPPILTILALALRVARRCLRALAGSIRTTAGRY
jgi:choline dehydrogenase-like flavoprotein